MGYFSLNNDAEPFTINSRYFWQDLMKLRVIEVESISAGHSQAHQAEIYVRAN
jgi:hypothetical protein